MRRHLLQQSPEVINRWIRRKIASAAPRIARFLMRRRLPLRERERREALESAFKTISAQAIKFEGKGYEACSTLFNIALFFLLAELDIQALKIDALTHPDEWTRKLCARIILLVIHEMDLDKVAGTKLQNALQLIGAPEHLRKEAIASLRAVRSVQNKVRREFAFLRNATIGHRDADALLQYRAIRNLKPEHVLTIAAEFYGAASGFITVLPKLMLESSSFPSLLRQLSKPGLPS